MASSQTSGSRNFLKQGYIADEWIEQLQQRNRTPEISADHQKLIKLKKQVATKLKTGGVDVVDSNLQLRLNYGMPELMKTGGASFEGSSKVHISPPKRIIDTT